MMEDLRRKEKEPIRDKIKDSNYNKIFTLLTIKYLQYLARGHAGISQRKKKEKRKDIDSEIQVWE